MKTRDNQGCEWNVSYTGRRSGTEFTDIRGGLDFKPYPAYQVVMLGNDRTTVWWTPCFVDWFINPYVAAEHEPHQWTETFE